MRACGVSGGIVLTMVAAVVVVQVVSGRSSSAVEIDFDCGLFAKVAAHGPPKARASPTRLMKMQ